MAVEEVAEGAAADPPRTKLISFAPFRHPAYARVWTGAFVSNIGTWMEAIALGIYVTEHTGQAAWTGTVAAAAFVPIAFFSPLGGALADRFPRRWLMILTSLFQMGLATLLTVLFVVGEPAAATLALIAFGNGIGAALGFPAYQAMLPDLVPVEDLPGAIALSSAQYNLGRVVGPALAGVVIAIGGYAWAEGVNAVSFLAVVAVMLTLHLPPPAPSRARSGCCGRSPTVSATCAGNPDFGSPRSRCASTRSSPRRSSRWCRRWRRKSCSPARAARRCSSPRRAPARC